ncbi:MAG: hypothetical protein ACP5T7_06400 [bacterium]
MNDLKDTIIEYLIAMYYPYSNQGAEPFLTYFLQHFDSVECIFMYGSMLNSQLSTPTSFPDFYIIVDDYKMFYGSNIHAILNRILPPNSYFLRLEQNGLSLSSKYCVLDTHALNTTTHYPELKDFFVAGRLAKRIGILYVRDKAFLSQFMNAVYNAMQFNVMFTLSEMNGAFSLEDFIIHLLGLSYRAEVRTETQEKIINLYNSEKSFYQRLYSLFLEQEVMLGTVKKIDNGLYTTTRPYFTKQYMDSFIKQSRRRAVYRWPKGIYTFSNYVEYLELKVERTTGEKLILSKWDRRFPLIFGWRHLFRLLKNKAIK